LTWDSFNHSSCSPATQVDAMLVVSKRLDTCSVKSKHLTREL
jgi:hypothetical protein